MLPPKYVKAARVNNRTNSVAAVTVVFGPKPGSTETIVEQQTISPNDSKEFKKTHDMGGWTAVAPVELISASFTVEEEAAAEGAAVTTTTHKAPDFIVEADRIVVMQEFDLTEGEGRSFAVEMGQGS
eukprot:CAMPEP_0185729104 /NCGR_PEP_ID=MMETSP1171-20130828/4470_1 /TAXON_ID=374046 /ORGANISM="Helicotheca tamensis, Strain CCMP826" /LENGTH=126 /DNA_ID=CAMNT_0028397881 /DNA_START=147 /DNA_END=527 /DNA_ORIENTATION=+